jgi:AP-2 complex subunit mu-1
VQREEASKITIQATGAISWRRNDVKYRKNEAFVDVIETVNLSMNSKGAFLPESTPPVFPLGLTLLYLTGTVLRADVDGQILMRAYLSGTPECKFGLNDKLVIDKKCVLASTPPPSSPDPDRPSAAAPAAARLSLHQERSRTARSSSTIASFTSASSSASSTAIVPSPSSLQTASLSSCGSSFSLFRPSPSISKLNFPLGSYRSTSNINLPFRVQPIVEEIGKSRVEYTVHVKAMFQPKLSASNVVIKIPTPLNAASVDCKVGIGKAKYVPAENMIIWKCVLSHTFFLFSPLSLERCSPSPSRRIPRFQGGSDATFTAEASLSQTTVRKAWSRPPISIDFQVLMFTASGLLVRFLKVFEKGNYQSVKVCFSF